MTKHKILYIHHYPRIGGSAISLSLLLKHLDQRRFDPILLLAQDGPVRALFKDLDIRLAHVPFQCISPYVKRPFWSPRALKNWLAFRPNNKLAEFLRNEEPDIIHLNDAPLLPAALVAKEMGIPIVWHIRGVIPREKSLQYNLLVKRIISLAEEIIGVTEDEANQFGPLAQAKVVYNSVDMDAIDAARGTGRQFRSEIRADKDVILIGAVIALTKEKGAWDFIRAAGLVQAACPDLILRFIIAGHASTHRRKLHRLRDATGFIGGKHPIDYTWDLARDVGVEDTLHLTGFRSDILSVIDALDIVVFPSRFESVGRAAIEGSALGKPTVATVSRKVTGLVVDGVTGLLTSPANPRALADTLVQLVRDLPMARQMGEAGRAYALEHFDARCNIEPIQQAYENILDGMSR